MTINELEISRMMVKELEAQLSSKSQELQDEIKTNENLSLVNEDLRKECEELRSNYNGLKNYNKALTEINVANEAFDNSQEWRKRHGIKEGDSFTEWFVNFKAKEHESEIRDLRKRCEDLEAEIENLKSLLKNDM